MPKKFGKILAAWRIHEFDKHNRSPLWYIGSGVVGAGLLIFALVTVNYLFAIIIIIVAFIVYVQEKSEPRKVQFLITTRGIKIGDKEYQYKDLSKFWILYDPPKVKKLYFTFKAVMAIRLMVPLKSQHPVKIREILLNFLEEDLEKEEEPISEAVGRWTKL